MNKSCGGNLLLLNLSVSIILILIQELLDGPMIQKDRLDALNEVFFFLFPHLNLINPVLTIKFADS